MARKIVSRSPHREVGVVNAAWLLDHPVEHESHLERRFIIAALACPVVTDIVHQPFTMPLAYGEGDEKYTPDFKITFADGGVVIVEVKPKVFISKHADKLRRAEEQMRADGLRFVVVTDEQIDGQALAARAMLLLRYGRLRFTDDEALDCLQALRAACDGDTTVRELVASGLSEPLIWNLVARHECRVPADFFFFFYQVITIQPVEGENHAFFKSWFGLAQG